MSLEMQRRCARCSQWYPFGSYRTHRDANHPTRKHISEGLLYRTCKACGELYLAGTFIAHSRAKGHAASWGQRSGSDADQAERNAAIIDALKADPYLTLQAVADQHAITRERVRQIWKRESGIKSAARRPHRPDKTCTVCGGTFPDGSGRAHQKLAGHGPAEHQYLRNREWEALYRDGLSSVQIGRIYQQRASYIGFVLRRRSVPIRPAKGSHYIRKRHVDG